MLKWQNNGGIQFLLSFGNESSLGEVFIENNEYIALDYIDCNNRSSHKTCKEAKRALLCFIYPHLIEAIGDYCSLQMENK